jgi:hypothetical protein
MSPTLSRIACNRGVLGLTSTSCVLPLIVKRAMILPPRIAVLAIWAITPWNQASLWLAGGG